MTKNKLSRLEKRNLKWGLFFISATLIHFLIFTLFTLVCVFVLSFGKTDFLSPLKFVGLKNYIKAFHDPRTWTVFKNTFYFTFFATFFNVSCGLGLALLVNKIKNKPFSYYLRLSFFLPVIVSLVNVSLMWSNLLNTDMGAVNSYLHMLGIEPVGWLSNSKIALNTVIFVDVWKNCGFPMLIFLAALKNIPNTYYEVAQMEGANGWQTFRYITFPSVTPTVFFNIIYFCIGALQVFDSTKLLSNGGPGDATRSVAMYIYEKGFQTFDVGYGSAIAVMLFTIILGFTILQFKVSKLWVIE